MDFQENPQSILTFRVGPVLCCAPSFPVRSIITPPKLTHPPGSDPAQPGIFRHGSAIVKVIDLRQRFGIDKADQTDPGHLIITVFDDASYAFWVDQILDVFDFPTEGWGALPAAIPRGIFTRTLLLKNQIHLYSEFIKLSQLHDLGYLKHYIQQLKQKEQTPAEPPVRASITPPAGNKVSAAASTTDIPPSIPPSNPVNNPVNMGAVKTPAPGTAPARATTTLPSSHVPHAASAIPALSRHPAKPPKAASMSVAQETPPVAGNKEVKPRASSTITTRHAQRFVASNHSQQNTSESPGGTPAPVSSPGSANLAHTAMTPAAAAATTAKHLAKQPAATASHRVTTTVASEQEETISLLVPLVIFFLLLSTLGAAVYFFLAPGAAVTTARGISAPEINEAPLYTAEKTQPDILDATPVVVTPAENLPVTGSDEIKSAPAAYKAEISHSADEVTITIHTPKSTEEEKSSESNSSHLPENSAPAGVNGEALTPAQPAEKNHEAETAGIITIETVNETIAAKPLTKEKPVKEIIHIVVKGDTLWAIAKKYVHDPFLYPELARLSNIKNPHRIYPGNRVRIRFVKD